jgi:glutamate synthase domain-containing protein 2
MRIAKPRVNVKLVSEVGVGTIAAELQSKSRCDLISGLMEVQVLHR